MIIELNCIRSLAIRLSWWVDGSMDSQSYM